MKSISALYDKSEPELRQLPVVVGIPALNDMTEPGPLQLPVVDGISALNGKTTAIKLGPHAHAQRAPKPRVSAVIFCFLAKEARTKQGACEALVVEGQMHAIYPISAQAAARGAARCASPALGRGAQVAARGTARCAVQALDRGAQAVALWCFAST